MQAHAQPLQHDLQKLMRRFGRQCRRRGKVCVTLVHQTETHLPALRAQVPSLARAAQQRLHGATSWSEAQRARLHPQRTGPGGIVGQQRPYFSWRFVVDFAGGTLAELGTEIKVEAVITASRGQVEITSARPLEAVRGYRAMFDLKPTDHRLEPITLRLYLRANDQPLTETWLYQWTPPERRTF